MTLNNARKRFSNIGCELERSFANGRYKYRPVSEGRWRYGDCLQALLIAAHQEITPKRSAAMSTDERLMEVLAS